MDNPFIYGLLFVFFFVFQLLRSAFNSINQLQLELDKSKAGYHSSILNYISLHTQDFITTLSIFYFTLFITLVSLSEKFFISSISERYFLVLLSYIGIIAILIFILIVIRTIGEYFSNEIINLFAVPIFLSYIIGFPITKLITFFSGNMFKSSRKENVKTEQKTFNKEDLNKLVTDNQKHTSADEEVDSEIKLFKNALEFSEIKLRECIIPRTEIVATELNDLNEELFSLFIKTGLSKIIVYSDNIDNIIGYVTSKSLLSNHTDYRKSIKNISIFPESMHANKLLRFFIKMGQSIAVIVDEFGGTSGLITIEDILEEIFGEIKDEHDTEELYEKKLSEYDFIFSGRIEIDYVNEKYNLNWPENDEYVTIAGFILNHTEKIPTINDHIVIDQFSFNILKVSDTRIDLVKLEIIDKNL
jgi:magnesium and cobalt exporter, CNNM family